MPELPEVETVRRGLEPGVVGRCLSKVHCFREGLRYPFPDFSGLQGACFASIQRRAKYLLFFSDQSQVLVWHLGMTGQFHLLPADTERARHEHVRLILDDGQALVYRDPRRFGYCDLLPSDGWEEHPWFSRLGVEPLSNIFDGDALYAAIHQRKAPIKQVLMDAAVVVGVGNIYASESLFRAGINPKIQAGRISKLRCSKLVDAVRQVLSEAVAAGGSTISDFVHVDGKPGYFAHDFRVYGRQGMPCPACATSICKIVQSGRSTFYCPACQRS